MRRFWSKAAVERTDIGFGVTLDGRPVRLPGGAALSVRSAALAAALAEEWQGAGGDRGGAFKPADTPLTRLAATAVERIAPDPAATIDALAKYGGSDLLCYRADRPEALAARQHEIWQPWLDWAETRFGARLRVVAGVMPATQDAAAIARLHAALATSSVEALAGLGLAVPALGSLILGLALRDGALDAATAHAAATLDERFQAEAWGEDAEAATRRRALAADVALAARFMALAGEIAEAE